MTVQVESRHTFMTIVSTVDDDCTCRQMIMSYHQASLSSRVRKSNSKMAKQRYILETNQEPSLAFSMRRTRMCSMNELVVTTMLVVQPTSRVHNPMAVPSKMMGDVWYKSEEALCFSRSSYRDYTHNPLLRTLALLSNFAVFICILIIYSRRLFIPP